MASRLAARYISRRFSSGGKILSEEEKAAENIYIKVLDRDERVGTFPFLEKTEQEKLEKLARKGPKPEESASSGSTVTDAKPSVSSTSGASAEKVSTDKNRNYAIVAGTVTIFGALGWYLKASSQKPEEVQD